MAAVRDRIYQTSDLTGAARREFLEQARHDLAQLRTPDGDALVMLRKSRLDHLMAIREYAIAYLMLDNALSRPRADRRAADFGPWAFIDVFDEEDVVTFRDEVNAVLIRAAAIHDATLVEETLAAWRTSASTMADPVARTILDGEDDPADWVEIDRPAED